MNFRKELINHSLMTETIDQHGLFTFELLEVAQEIRVPLLAVSQTREFALRIGHVGVDEEEVAELGGQHPAFAIGLRLADAPGDAQRRGLAEQGGAGVTLLFRAVPEG